MPPVPAEAGSRLRSAALRAAKFVSVESDGEIRTDGTELTIDVPDNGYRRRKIVRGPV